MKLVNSEINFISKIGINITKNCNIIVAWIHWRSLLVNIVLTFPRVTPLSSCLEIFLLNLHSESDAVFWKKLLTLPGVENLPQLSKKAYKSVTETVKIMLLCPNIQAKNWNHLFPVQLRVQLRNHDGIPLNFALVSWQESNLHLV